MKRGEIWTVLGSAYTSKPRPVLVIQDDSVGPFDSTILCLFTSVESLDVPTRVRVIPSEANGLRKESWVMTDKVYSARKDELGMRIGELEADVMREVSLQIAKVLGITPDIFEH